MAYESNGLMYQALNFSVKEKSFSSSSFTDYPRPTTQEDSMRYRQMTLIQESLPPDYVNQLNHLTPKSNELDKVFNGWMAEQDGKIDEAIFYYNQLWGTHSYYVQSFAQIRLAKIYLSINRPILAACAINNFTDSYITIRQGEQISRELIQHHARYQDRRSKQEISRLSLLNHRQLMSLITTVVMSLLLAGLLLLTVLVYRQRQVILRFRINKLRQWREEYL